MELASLNIWRSHLYPIYDVIERAARAADPTWNSLSKQDKRNIRAELNKFKQEEMDVHADSKHLLNIYKGGKKVKVPHAGTYSYGI